MNKLAQLIQALLSRSHDKRFADGYKMHGSMTAVLVREDGEVEVTRKDNIIVNVGFDFIANAIGNSGARPACMGWIAVGTSATAPAAGDSGLGSELNRQAATFSHSAGTKTFTFQSSYAAGVATGALTEAGVLNASTGGTLFDHVSFNVINKGANDTLTITFTFTMS